jgi:hypothetical protein
VSKIQAEEITEITADNFKFCIDGLTRHAGGFQWKNLDEDLKELWIAEGYTLADLKYKTVVQFGSKAVLKYKIESKLEKCYILGALIGQYESIGKGRKEDDPKKEIPETTFRRLVSIQHVKGEFYYLIGEKQDELIANGSIKLHLENIF